MRTISMFVAALTVAGCGSMTSRVARLETTIEEQRELIAQLQAERLTGVRAESADDDSDSHPNPLPQAGEGEREGDEPASRLPHPASRPIVAPMPVTPQHWGSMHGAPPVAGTCPAVLNLHIVNSTDHYVSVLLDGVAVQVGGGAGILPHLPPGQRVEVCLTHLERHTIGGRLFTVRGQQVVDLGMSFMDPDVQFDSTPYPYEYQRYAITDATIRRHRLR